MFLWFFVLDYFLDFSFFSFDLYLFLNLVFFYLHLFLFFLLFFCSDYLDLHRPILLLLLYHLGLPFGLPSLPFILWCLWLGLLLRHIYYVIFFMYIFDFSIFLTVIIDNFLGLTVWYDVQQKQSVNLGNRCSCSDSYIALSCIFSLFSVRETSS